MLVRELKKEAGIEIKVGRFLDGRIISNATVRARWYFCSPLTYNLKPDDDLVEIKYVAKSEILEICDQKAISSWHHE